MGAIRRAVAGDPLCFFTLVGNFREITPSAAIKRKRQLDRAVYANRRIFGESFLDAYDAFMALCFQTFVAVGQDAKIRASVARQRVERGPTWDDSWTELFVREEDVPRQPDLIAAYNKVLETYDEL